MLRPWMRPDRSILLDTSSMLMITYSFTSLFHPNRDACRGSWETDASAVLKNPSMHPSCSVATVPAQWLAIENDRTHTLDPLIPLCRLFTEIQWVHLLHVIREEQVNRTMEINGIICHVLHRL